MIWAVTYHTGCHIVPVSCSESGLSGSYQSEDELVPVALGQGEVDDGREREGEEEGHHVLVEVGQAGLQGENVRRLGKKGKRMEGGKGERRGRVPRQKST